MPQTLLSLLLLYCTRVCMCGILGFLQPDLCCLKRVLPLMPWPLLSLHLRSSPPVSCSRILLHAFSHPSSSRKKKILWHLEEIGGKSNLRSLGPSRSHAAYRGSETLALFEPLTSLQLKWRRLGYFSPLVLSSALMGEWRARAPPARDIRRLWRCLCVMGLS